MALIEFGDVTILDDAEGVYQATIGIRQPITEEVQQVRADGELTKHYGRAGCDHVLQISYLSQVSPATITARLDTLAANKRSGTLFVDGLGSYSNCRVKSISELQVKREAYDLSPTLSPDTRWTITVTIIFRQTR